MNSSESLKTKNSYRNKTKLSIILLLVSAILFFMAKYIGGFSNLYYKYIYLILVNTIARAFSLVPISVYEIILYAFCAFVIIKIIMFIYLKLRERITFKEIILKSITDMFIYLSLFIFLNVISQGINSFKDDFVQLTNLNINDTSEEKLIELCEYLKNNINELDNKIDKDDLGFLKLDNNVKQHRIENMENLGETYFCLQGFYPNPKPYIFSKIMSYQLLEGETTFTIEANYNNDMPKWNVPSTICHELSHIRGFNNEDEANYISFLSCINSKSYEYQYSGYLMAYTYCMNDLYRINLDAFKKINSDLSNNVKNELKNDSNYWSKYEGGISDLYNKTYDVLLKMGGQEAGIASYNGVVKLLVSGYKVQFF